MRLTHVVTSKAFIDRIGVAVEGAQFIFLEDLRGGMGKLELLLDAAGGALARQADAHGMCRASTPRQPAVVLFTSGSEKAPKAVPLTHHNLLTNQRDGISVFRADAPGFAARLPAGVSQFRPVDHRTDAAARRHARGSSSRPDRRRRPDAQDRRLQADHARAARRLSSATSSSARSRATWTRCA